MPKPLDAFRPAANEEIARLSALNPHKPVEYFVSIVEEQVQFKASYKWQFHEAFEDRHMADFVAVVMLSHSLCEALINAVLAIGLAQTGNLQLFGLLERSDFVKKWVVAPKAISPTYEFPRGSGLHEALLRLSRQRNSMVHHQIDLEIEGKPVLAGSGFDRQPYDDERRWARRFFSLPYDLADFVDRALPVQNFMLLLNSRSIERAAANSAA